MSLIYVIGIIVMLTLAIYLIVIGASRIIADRVTKYLKEEHLIFKNKNGKFIPLEEIKKRNGL